MNKYKDWELLQSLPDGWRIDKSAGSPLCGYEFCTNGKSLLNGQKRALLFVGRKPSEYKRSAQNPFLDVKQEPDIKEYQEHPAKAVNELARKKFEQRLLNDIMVDLAICEIEGWCKMEYIRELRKLLAGIASRKQINISRLTDDEGDRQTRLRLI
jgi:hypothetical protein